MQILFYLILMLPIWTVVQPPVYDSTVLIIFSVWNVLVRDTIFSFSLTGKLRYNSSFELAGAQGGVMFVIWISTGQNLSPCGKANSVVILLRRNFSYQNLAGHTNDIWWGLHTGASLQVMVRSLLCLPSILSYPTEPIIPGSDRSLRL